MQPNITQVEWSATNVPSGLSFNAQTGTFSGTPTTSGTYTVPVHVETNYGEDTKDVIIAVRTASSYEALDGNVYAIGYNAAMWSNDAEPDDYGFRKLHMPKVKRLVSLTTNDWAAQAEDGTWYACTSRLGTYDCFGINSFSPTVPTEIPLNDITEVAYGAYCCFLDSKSDCRAYRVKNTGSDPVILPNVKKLSSDNSHQYAIIDENGDRIELNTSSGAISKYAVGLSADSIKTVVYNHRNILKILTYEGELYDTNNTQKVDFPYGKIKEIYSDYSMNILFILTEDNDLYVTGEDVNCVSGLPTAESDTSFTKVGNYNVKYIRTQGARTFMLLEDGTLWHTGSGVYTDDQIIETHQEFTQIFPDLKFKDIAIIYNTLVVTMKE